MWIGIITEVNPLVVTSVLTYIPLFNQLRSRKPPQLSNKLSRKNFNCYKFVITLVKETPITVCLKQRNRIMLRQIHF